MNRRLNRMAGDIDALRARSAALTRRIATLEAAATPLCAPVAAATPPDGATCQTEPQTAQTGTYSDGYRDGWNDARHRNNVDAAASAPPHPKGQSMTAHRYPNTTLPNKENTQ